MSIQLKTRLKVSSVSSVQGPDGKEYVKITFVQQHTRPPPMSVMPQNSPKEIGSVILQVQKGIQQVLPRNLGKFQKIIVVFTSEELEAFDVKPYPNQTFEVAVTNGNLHFSKVVN
jgi:hypothetical protein